MESKLWLLLKIEFLNQLHINTIIRETDSKKKRRAVLMAVLMVWVVLMMGGYCFGLAYGFGKMGISYVVPGYALTISSIVVLIFTFFKTNGVLFAFHDYEMLTAFPIQAKTVITAKFLSMYLNNLLFTAVVMVPMAAGFGCFCDFTWTGLLSWLIGILIAPLLPMAIAAIIGALIAASGAGFKNKAIVQMVLTVLLFVAIFGGSFYLNGRAQANEDAFLTMIADFGGSVSGLMHRIYPPSLWFDEAVTQGVISSLFRLLGVSSLVYAVFVTFCGKQYRRINTALLTHHATHNYRLGHLKSSSAVMAVAKKEARKFLSSSIYMINMGVGLILALLASVASIFIGIDQMLDGIDIELANVKDIDSMLVAGIPFLIAMIVNMTNTCAVSLSLEGKNLWVVQSLPIERGTLLKGKMLFNVMLVLPVSLVCNMLFMIELRVSIFWAFLYLLFAVVSVLFSAVFGCFINVKFPNYKWQNEVEVVKQGASSMLAIFGSMFGYLVLAAAVIGIGKWIPAGILMLGVCVMMVMLGCIIYYFLTKQGE